MPEIVKKSSGTFMLLQKTKIAWYLHNKLKLTPMISLTIIKGAIFAKFN
jgi:hypothetical protein